MIRHHPLDELLLAHAAGRLDAGSRIVITAHCEQCAACSARVRALEALGGLLVEETEPVAMAAAALDHALAALDPPSAAPAAVAARTRPRPSLPAGVLWPRALRDCEISGWHWIGPGMRWGRVRAPEAPDANIFLLRMAAGRTLARHTHSGRELTQVLYGSFSDERAGWGLGEFDETDPSVRHRPAVDAGSECICLVSVDGRIRFEGAIARALGAWMGI